MSRDLSALSPAQRIERSLQKTYRDRIWGRFIAGIKEYRLLEPGDRVAVCISGGKDSMLLAKLLQMLQRQSDFPFTVQYLVMDPGYAPENRRQIEENLALANRRGKRRGLRWGVTQTERENYRQLLTGLGLGLEKRMTAKVGLLSGGQRQALTLLMAALQTPKLLLLDEHTAALDPATAAKVLELSDKIIQEHHLTAMMITHNMTDAIRHGNRLIMMDRGRIVLDISGEEKKRLTKADLLARFAEKAGVQEETDEVLLS